MRREPSTPTGPVRRLLDAPWALVAGFLVVHAAVGWRAVQLRGMGDLRTYAHWAADVVGTGHLLGIGRAWVYPELALPPILAAGVFGSGAYLVTWVLLATLCDAIVTVLLARRDPRLAWWFLAVVLLLGPITQARIDEVVLPLAVGGVLLVRDRPAVATVLFTLGAWIKVWPALLVAALLIAGRRRLAVLGAAAGTCAVVVGVAVALGARGTLLSFIGTQSSRGLQIEAPAAAPFLWSVAAGQHGARIFFDRVLLTEQVAASGTRLAAAVATPILAAGVLAIVGLAVRARMLGASAGAVLAWTGFGLVAAVIALNKVGSPQYMTWYVAPVVLGLVTDARRWRFPAVAVPAAALLTQVVYPTFYPLVLRADPALLVVLDARDLLEVALLAWALVQLVPGVVHGGAGRKRVPSVARSPARTI